MRNAIAYYNRLISTKSLTDCTAAIVRDKVRHLQKKYAEAIRWTNETGQGIRDSESEATFDSKYYTTEVSFDELSLTDVFCFKKFQV